MLKNEDNPVPQHILKDIITTLNNIPNHFNVGPNGESSYKMAHLISKYMKGVETNKEQPCSAGIYCCRDGFCE